MNQDDMFYRQKQIWENHALELVSIACVDFPISSLSMIAPEIYSV